jgi:hypothetical protein
MIPSGMGIFIIWLVFALLVGIAASSRGRSGVGWFFLAVIISPLIGILFVLAMPNLKHEAFLDRITKPEAPPLPRTSIGGKSTRVTVDRTPRPFEADGVYAGVPYRVASDGSIDAIMQGAMVRFRDFDRFTGSVGGLGHD